MQNDAPTLHENGQLVLQKLVEYLDKSQAGDEAVLIQKSATEIANDLQISKHIRHGNAAVLPFLTQYLKHTQHLHHPNYVGHQVAAPHIASSMADFIHGIVNNPMAIYEMGPAAAVIERVIINWMLEKVGWFQGKELTDFAAKGGAGILTHGGSLATLTALLAARAHIAPKAWEEGTPNDLVVLTPSNSHYAVARAISIMGLGSRAIVHLPTNDLEQIKVSQLSNILAKVRANGKRVMAIIANACATSTGLYDDLEAIGQFCQANNLWLHVDGAHGASALISEKERHFLKGITYANSIIWDAHKMLQTSSLCAAVLFKNPALMTATFQQKASYLLHDKEQIGFDVIEHTIECTKAPLGTKLYWNLAFVGEQKLAQFIENQRLKTRQFYDLIQKHPNFDAPYFPQANILCFRYTAGDSSNEFQLKLRNKIIQKGKFYITSAEVNGLRYLRVTIMNEKTEITHLEELLAHVTRLSQAEPL